MNTENTTYLIEHFPRLYRGVTKSPKESLMCFYFECGDGWFELIKKLSEKLEPLDIEAIQVKEKWGGLRFYITGGTPEAWDLIEAAEAASETICEHCGAPGKTRGKTWVQTLCDTCSQIDP